MPINGQKIALLVDDMYNDYEFIYPNYRLREAGAQVVVVAQKAGEFKSKQGLPQKADVAVDQVSAADFAGVVIPGGYAPDMMRRSPALVDLVRQIVQAGKPSAAICHAGWMLCSADVLQAAR